MCGAGKACLELGCGTGLTGVALARVGARPVLTDGAAFALDNCRANLELNGIAVQPGADFPDNSGDGTAVQVGCLSDIVTCSDSCCHDTWQS